MGARAAQAEDETNDGTAYINHNSDWSGEAIVSWMDNGGEHEVRLPAWILVAGGKKAAIEFVRNAVVEALEEL